MSVLEVALQVNGGIQLRSANISYKRHDFLHHLQIMPKKIIIHKGSAGVSKKWSSEFTSTR